MSSNFKRMRLLQLDRFIISTSTPCLYKGSDMAPPPCLATIRVKCEAIGCHCSSIDSIVSFHLGMYGSRDPLSSPKDCVQ